MNDMMIPPKAKKGFPISFFPIDFNTNDVASPKGIAMSRDNTSNVSTVRQNRIENTDVNMTNSLLGSFDFSIEFKKFEFFS